MAEYDELTSEQAAKLKPGDIVNVRSVQSNQFRSYYVDGCNVLGMYPHQMVLSFTRTEPRNIVNTSVVKNIDPNGSAQVEPKRIVANPVVIEDLQIRMRPDVATEVAIAIFINLGELSPGEIKSHVKANPKLAFLFEG